MTLYSNPRSAHSHRVRLVLAEKNIAVDVVDADPQDLPGDVMDLNPYGTLPVLVDRELVLYESRIIMEYLDERFPHPPCCRWIRSRAPAPGFIYSGSTMTGTG